MDVREKAKDPVPAQKRGGINRRQLFKRGAVLLGGIAGTEALLPGSSFHPSGAVLAEASKPMTGGDSERIWIFIPAGERAFGIFVDDYLKKRVVERGMTGRFPLAGEFPHQRVEVIRTQDPFATVNELFYRRGWTDGFPIVPPTAAKVEEMLIFADRPRYEGVGIVEPGGGEATVEKIAINAVMAGCRPEYLPLIIASVEAITDSEFYLKGVQTTDENVTPLLIVNGPIAGQLEINSSFGALGPGWQANATIGRAIRLIMNNIGGGWPVVVSPAGLAQPGRYTLCLAENEAGTPWKPLHVELNYDRGASTVTAMRAESVVNVTGGLAEVASVMGSMVSCLGMRREGRVAVILSPFVAQKLGEKGWSKDDVKQYLWEQGRVPVYQWEQSWLTPSQGLDVWPAWVKEAAKKGPIPVVKTPDEITVIVAGGDFPIAQHAYIPAWGFPCRVTREVRLPVGWEDLLRKAKEKRNALLPSEI